jgi:hypothetical protein
MKMETGALSRRAARSRNRALENESRLADSRAARRVLRAAAATVGAAVLVASPAFADTLRCGSSLVQPGATIGFVQEKCGAPQSKETFSEPILGRRANGTTYEVGTTSKNVWRYKRGSGSFPAVLTFEKGVLTKLEFEK